MFAPRTLVWWYRPKSYLAWPTGWPGSEWVCEESLLSPILSSRPMPLHGVLLQLSEELRQS